ncbi:GerAB/ArcD/ProY family transporter [Oceanobacillus halophilus]|uniref:Spore gernimation protein n=1 Tax=Oceanobacillus halophilus TaxID=930130 RepID=A0A494ZTE7_9BACI|nr:endospore germination permease [Oceanobacillus halophilus]RKQ28552.1 spore gernimation protein [Oceanobacillus halophilus]
MNKPSDKVTNLQLAFIIISTMLGVSMLGLTHFTVRGAGNAAPFASLVGIFIAFIGLMGYVLIGRRFTKDTLVGYNESILGKPIGRLCSFLIVIVFLALTGLETRQFAEAVQGSILPNTPMHISIIAMILLFATTSFQRVDTFASIHFFYVPLILIPIIIVVAPAFRDIEIYHMTPILGNDPTWGGFMNGALAVTQAIGNFVVIAMVIPFMKYPKKSWKGAVGGFWIAGFIVIFMTTMTVAVFGENEIKKMYWPLLNLGRMITIPGEVLSRIDAVLLVSWVYGVFTTLLSYYFLVVRGVCGIFRFHHYRVVSLITAPIIYGIAIFPRDIYTLYDYIRMFSSYGVVPLLVYPFFLLCISIIRKKKGGSV